MIPKTILRYFNKTAYLLMNFAAWPVKAPTMRNGIPSPKAYVKSKKNADPGAVAASPKMTPRAGPTQGVQPAANAKPKRNEVK